MLPVAVPKSFELGPSNGTNTQFPKNIAGKITEYVELPFCSDPLAAGKTLPV